jgi:hypothetical protein
VSYDWKNETESSSGRREIGYIAQEVEAVFPELVYPLPSAMVVSGGGNATAAEDTEEAYKGVAYSRLCVVALEAVKELHTAAVVREDAAQAKAAALAEKVATLETQVATLTAQVDALMRLVQAQQAQARVQQQ